MPKPDTYSSHKADVAHVVRLLDLLDALVEKGGLPRKVEEEAKAAHEKTLAEIKKTLQNECKLQLLKPGAKPSVRSHFRLPVEFLPGCPVGFENVEINASSEAIEEALLLASHRDDLKKISDGGPGALVLHEKLASQSWDKPNSPSSPDSTNIEAVTMWAKTLLARLDETADKITRGILLVKGDCMGAYYCHPPVRIELYWAVIGLIAKLHGWEAHDLAIKVLAHELAHAYTQLGVDTDGECWPAEKYAQTDLYVAESLAQYYTHRALEHLAHKDDELYGEAFRIYEELCPKQHDAYQVHRAWIDNDSPEIVRQAMLGLRRNGETNREQLANRLSDTRNTWNLSRN